MTDIAIVWDTANARGDWTVRNGDLGIGPDIQSAVLVSLFTDRLASSDYISPDPAAINDRRGWWGDTYEPSLIGSRLWQLDRSKKTDQTTLLNQARDYCAEALQWLLDDGVAASISVTTFWNTRDQIGIVIDITKPGVGQAETFQFQWAWNGF
jgi:phage gp46-like protein